MAAVIAERNAFQRLVEGAKGIVTRRSPSLAPQEPANPLDKIALSREAEDARTLVNKFADHTFTAQEIEGERVIFAQQIGSSYKQEVAHLVYAAKDSDIEKRLLDTGRGQLERLGLASRWDAPKKRRKEMARPVYKL
jgi:hypothetical protein